MFVKDTKPAKAIPKSVPVYADGKEYIVCLKQDVDYDTFWTEMETQTSDHPNVPDRPIRIFDERPVSLRSCHYVLTDQEAVKLSSDSRVLCVELPPKHRNDIVLTKHLIENQNFDKVFSYTRSTGDNTNWGLRRVNAETNIYGIGTHALGGYEYVLDGTGVDVVIQDTGIQADHPEFNSPTGTNRVQQINWYSASGVSGSMPTHFYEDTQGHGTHVAGIVAGKTYGWAKNARIYMVKVEGLTDQTGIDVPQCFDVITGWHLNKPIDPATGYRRPTIVNASWGYGGSYSNLAGGTYRGTPWTGTLARADYGMGQGPYFPARVSAADVAVEEMIAAGVHICIAAGNNGMKIDTETGPDWNNTWTDGIYDYAYQQGGSPYSHTANMIGSIDYHPLDPTRDTRAIYSEVGPGVMIYSPGTGIFSACSTINTLALEGYAAAPYHLDSRYKQANLSGTSMASPNACGLGALALQLHPGFTPTELQQWYLTNGKHTLYSTGLDDDYSNVYSVVGGDNLLIYNPYAANKSVDIAGTVNISGPVSIKITK